MMDNREHNRDETLEADDNWQVSNNSVYLKNLP